MALWPLPYALPCFGKSEKLEKLAGESGYKKLNELIILFSRFISNNIRGKGCFFGHTLMNNFVVVGSHEEMDKEILSDFKKMMPYIGDQFDKNLKLEVSKLNSREIVDKNWCAEDILEQMKIK